MIQEGASDVTVRMRNASWQPPDVADIDIVEIARHQQIRAILTRLHHRS